MNISQIHNTGLYIMLWSIMAAVFRQHEPYVYAIFLIGFVLAIIPIEIQKISPQAIITILIPMIALHAPLPLPLHIPGLIRLGIIICVWVIILTATTWLSSAMYEQWIDNHTRQKGK